MEFPVIASILFWGTLGAVLYSYFVYPIIVILMVKIRGARPTSSEDGDKPAISMVISMYNEQDTVLDKLKNIEAIDYPRDKMEFLFGSDGSDDRTNDILRSSSLRGLRLFAFPKRRGKLSVLNDLVPRASGGIVVFSDANTLYAPDTVRNLVRHFADPQVGAVCGELLLRDGPEALSGSGELSYWRYENTLKRWESDFQTILGATGGVYAIRKALFVQLPTRKSLADDFLIPLGIVKQGYRVIYEPEARAFEKPSGSVAGEFRRKVRIGAMNFVSIPEFASLLHPRRGFVAFALWSHKIIRWFVPFLGIMLLLATAVLAGGSDFYRWVLIGEGAFLVLALAGYFAERLNLKAGYLSIPYYFVAMNLALLIGFFKFALGLQRPTWEVLR